MASLANIGLLVAATLLLTSSATGLSSDFPTSVDEFSGRFYKEVVNQDDNKGKNTIMSPLSADVVMSMVALGAQGETKKEITNSLCMEDIDKMTSSIQTTLDAINKVEGVTLELANKLYVKPSRTGKLDTIVPSYKTSVQNIFKSETQQIDFSQSAAAAAEINKWVEDHTNNKIKDLISKDDLSDLTAAVLVNAIYFKGRWAKKFKVENTKKEDFCLADGSKIKVDMMKQKNKFLYRDAVELDAQIIVLPYEKEQVSLVVILPKSIDGLPALESKLANGTKQFLTDLYEFEVILSLPKFLIETKIDVKDVFEKLGTKLVFNQGMAELRGIVEGKEDLYVSSAVQKAFIEVNEEGAEAAAATAGGIFLLSAHYPDEPPTVFKADHSFYYQIVHDDLTLFSGAVTGKT